MLTIPQYVPIPREKLQDFESLRDACLPVKELKHTEEQILQAAMDFLDQIMSSEEDTSEGGVDRLAPLKRLLESFENIVQAQYTTEQFGKMFNEVKQKVRDQNRGAREFDIDSLDYYNGLDADDMMFSKLLEKKMAQLRPIDIKTKYRNNPDYVYLKNAAFILDHPEDPIPDENEDDDIHIEGGKVDLRCPIVMKIFENPMTSTKCGHTFSLEGVNGTWQTQNAQTKCPTPGCDKRLRKSDFKPDRLMTLRIKAYQRLQSHKGDNTQYERLWLYVFHVHCLALQQAK